VRVLGVALCVCVMVLGMVVMVSLMLWLVVVWLSESCSVLWISVLGSFIVCSMWLGCGILVW